MVCWDAADSRSTLVSTALTFGLLVCLSFRACACSDPASTPSVLLLCCSWLTGSSLGCRCRSLGLPSCRRWRSRSFEASPRSTRRHQAPVLDRDPHFTFGSAGQRPGGQAAGLVGGELHVALFMCYCMEVTRLHYSLCCSTRLTQYPRFPSADKADGRTTHTRPPLTPRAPATALLSVPHSLQQTPPADAPITDHSTRRWGRPEQYTRFFGVLGLFRPCGWAVPCPAPTP